MHVALLFLENFAFAVFAVTMEMPRVAAVTAAAVEDSLLNDFATCVERTSLCVA